MVLPWDYDFISLIFLDFTFPDNGHFELKPTEWEYCFCVVFPVPSVDHTCGKIKLDPAWHTSLHVRTHEVESPINKLSWYEWNKKERNHFLILLKHFRSLMTPIQRSVNWYYQAKWQSRSWGTDAQFWELVQTSFLWLICIQNLNQKWLTSNTKNGQSFNVS